MQISLEKRYNHFHVYRESADCDGRYTQHQDEFPSPEERLDVFGDMDFDRRVAGSMCDFWSRGTLEVHEFGMVWAQDTDEGFVRVEAVRCDDRDCKPQPSTHRDHRAEAAGY